MDAEKLAEHLDQCSWPALDDPYDVALHEAVEFTLRRFDVLGIFACGSILRGDGDPLSDIDLYVVNADPFRQRIQRRFAGVPFEIFVNPAHQIRKYFVEEQAAARPLTAHMLATGHVVFGCDPIIEQLIDEARMLLAQPHELPESKAVFLRYFAVDMLDNAEDVREADPGNATLILHQAVSDMIDYFFLADGQFLPRQKETLRTLERCNPAAGALARRFYVASDLDTQFKLAKKLAADILGETTFFEWETKPEPLPTDGS